MIGGFPTTILNMFALIKSYQSRILLAVIAVSFGIFLHSESSAQRRNPERQKRKDELFRKIAAAEESLSYQATVITEYFGEETRKYERDVVKVGSTREWSKSNNRVFVIRDNLYFIKFLENDSVIVYNRRSRESIIGDIELLKKNYSVRFLPEEKIQDHLVDVVRIRFRLRHKDRAWLKIWVDKENGYVFRTEHYDAEDKKFFSRHSEDVKFDPEIDPELFEVDYTGDFPAVPTRKLYESANEVRDDLNISLVAPEFLPSGFSLNEISVRYRGHNNKPFVQFYYSDGLWSFSLFQETTERDNRDMRLRKRMGWLSISEIKNNLRYSFNSDIDLIAEKTLVKSFQTIKPLNDPGPHQGTKGDKKQIK